MDKNKPISAFDAGYLQTVYRKKVDFLVWVIYDKPLDYPDKFVARMYFNKKDGVFPSIYYMLADTLEEIRAMIPKGLARLPPFLQDDKSIVETWI